MNGILPPSVNTVPQYGVGDWIAILHNASRVPQTSPRYAEAQQVARDAVARIGDLQDSASKADQADIMRGRFGMGPGNPFTAAATAFGHGASLGLAGDPTYLALAHEAHPIATGAADIAGTVALGGAASPLVAGLSPVAGAAVLGGGLSAARGAIEPIPGFSRAESAAIQGTLGAVTGAALGKIANKLIPIARGIAANVARLLGRSAASADVAIISEAAIRAELTRLNVAPDVLERTVQSWKLGGASPKTSVPAPIARPQVRPGETIVPTPVPMRPIAGTARGFEVTGERAMPPVPTEPTVTEILEGRGLQARMAAAKAQQGTLPYYPRGGQAEQALGPAPQVSPSAPNALPMQQLQTLLRLPPDQFEAASALFPGEVMAQVRTLRADPMIGALLRP